MELEEYRKKIANLDVNEQKLRDLYLRKLSLGEIQGPPLDKASIDKKWLKNYTEEQIMVEMPKETIYDYMMKNNLNHLDDIALIYFDKKISFKELQNKIDKFAAIMLKSGVKAGDIVTVCMPNTPEAVIAFYALNKIGVVANMIHPLSSENEIKNFINEVDSKYLIAFDGSICKIADIVNETKLEKVVVVSPSDSMPQPLRILYNLTKNIKLPEDERFIKWKDFLKLDGASLEETNKHVYKKDEMAVILHTGGTTGIPKGVMLTNDNFNSMVEQFKQNANNFERGDVMMTVMPVFHGFGLCSSLHLPLSFGVTSLLIPKINIKEVPKLFKKYHINHVIGVPTLFKGILKNKENYKIQDLIRKNIKYIVSGGDLVKDNLEKEVADFFGVKLSKGYGLSEAVAGVTFAHDTYNSSGSIGIPMVDTNIKIVTPGTDEELMDGSIGEMCINGPTVMKGYYNHTEETAKALQNGWLHTGDLGYYQNGEFYFCERKGNMIISSGVNVYPNVIEQVIECHEAVNACAVIGIAHPYKIQVPKAYIILNEGYEVTQELENEIREICKKNLNVYSIPAKFEFREKLPQTLLGKISHNQLSDEEKQKVLSL